MRSTNITKEMGKYDKYVNFELTRMNLGIQTLSAPITSKLSTNRHHHKKETNYMSYAEITERPVYRDKGTPPKKGGGPVLLLQNYPNPLSPSSKALIISPLPLTLEPPEHDHHLPF